MDPVLPFRALSPSTHKPKFTHQRHRDTKLSLKSRQPHDAGKNKENNNPVSFPRSSSTKPSRLLDSELMTSDDSNSSILDKEPIGHGNSIIFPNSQDSTFALPVAESTRRDLTSVKTSELVESTIATMQTACNGSTSSANSDYFTAYPYPVGCDESIVCISDSSSESLKTKLKKTTRTVESVLLTSDESDCESDSDILPPVRKCADKRVCDTVVLDSSDSETSDCDVGKSDCGVVIPSSIKSSNGSHKSSAGCLGTDMQYDVDGIVIPPSPDRCSEASDCCSLISEDDVKLNTVKKGKAVVSLRSLGLNYDDAEKRLIREQAKQDESCKGNEETSFEPKSNESSWKDDFRLVMPESFAHTENQNQSNSGDSDLLRFNQVTSSISKDKFNEITRWLFSGKHSESCLDAVSSSMQEERKSLGQLEQVTPVDKAKSFKHPQINKLSIVRKSSFGSENDDDFNALMDSMRSKQKSQKKEKRCKEDSFIDDECASDVKSPLSNIYHSDLTKSIKAEIKSIKDTASSITKRQLFRHLYDSDEEIGGSSSDLKPVKGKESNFRSIRKAFVSLDTSDSSDSEPTNLRGAKKIIDSETESDEGPKSHSKGASKTSDGIRNKFKKKTINSCERKASDTNKLGSEKLLKSKTQTWRKHADMSNSTDSCTSTSSSNISDDGPKQMVGKDRPAIISGKPLKALKEILPVATPKKIAALKSPGTPYSPIRTFLSSLSGPTRVPGVRDHPEACVYNNSFKSKKEELTRRLFKLFNREVFDKRLPVDMLLEWNARLVRTAGLCYCKLVRKGGVTTRTAKIALSTKVITSPDRLRDTLIHEMCHTAVWLLNNVSGGGHGPFWKAWALKAMKRFPELPPIKRCHSYKIETKYTYKCTKCGYSFGRHSKSLDLVNKRCGHCYGTFEVFLSSKGESSKENVMKTPKAPSAFALFVKENYGLLKKENEKMKHGDIMKKLGEKFTSMKVQES